MAASERGACAAGGQTQPPYRGPDRRSRTASARDLPLSRALPATLLACIGCGVPALVVAYTAPGIVSITSYLSNTAALIALAAGITCLASWRITGLVLPGWTGSGLVALGLLTFTETAVSRLGSNPTPEIPSTDQLIVFVIAGLLVGLGLLSPEVDGHFNPFIVLVGALGAGILLLGGLDVVRSRGLLPGALDGRAGSLLAIAAAGGVWLALGAVAARSGRRRWGRMIAPVPKWLAGATLAIGAGVALLDVSVPVPWVAVLATAIELAGLALWFGGSLAQLQEQIRTEDRHQVQLGRALDDSRRQATMEHEGVEELLHSLRNAVAGLRAADAYLRQSATDVDPKRMSLADAVSAEIGRLEGLVEWERPPKIRPVRLDALLTPLVVAERSQGADISCAVGGELVFADADGLAEVVQNILTNARLYAPGGTIVVSADQIGPAVELSIQDEGPGIVADELATLFGRGVRGRASAGTKGSGLGLYLARRHVQAMGGSLRLVADGPVGSRFVVSLPAVTDPQTQTTQTRTEADAEVEAVGVAPAP